MQLISAILSDFTTVSLITSEDTEEDPESFSHHLMINGKLECSYSTWEHAWEDYGHCVRCATLKESVNVARG
jgi:hypothetical protein